jgi:hypothetical protein
MKTPTLPHSIPLALLTILIAIVTVSLDAAADHGNGRGKGHGHGRGHGKKHHGHHEYRPAPVKHCNSRPQHHPAPRPVYYPAPVPRPVRRPAPAVYAHGVVSVQACPYSCRTTGIPKSHCRDWRQGNACIIEDLRYSGDGRVPPIPQHLLYPVVNNAPPHYGSGYDHGANHGASGTCDSLPRGAITPPRIEIHRVESGGFLSSKVRVLGTVEGQCIREAGGFEEGFKVSNFQVPLTPNHGRYEFSTELDSSDIPEIRAYTIYGDRAVQSVQGGASPGSSILGSLGMGGYSSY